MISVCIAAYNGAANIRTQILSILPQLGVGDEIIISDDGSTDDTRKIIEEIGSPLIQLIEGSKTGSLIDNFEKALSCAKGDYIFLSDQDDKWVENKVTTMVAHLQAGVDCVVSDCFVTDETLAVTQSSFYASRKKKDGFFYNLLLRNGYLGCCMAFNRAVLNKSLPFPKHIPMHDIWIGNVAALCYKVKFINDKLIYFRRHNHNASHTAAKSPYSWQEKIAFRWHVLMPLILRYFRS